MLVRFLGHLRQQWMGALALFLVLTGGVAYAANTVFSADIVDGEVKTADIGNNQVRTADVRNDNLAGGGLTSADIGDDEVSSDDIGDNLVSSDDIRDDSLRGGGLSSDDITDLTGDDIADSTLTNDDLGTGSVGASEIADNAIDGGEIVNNSLTGGEITDNSLTGGEIADNNLTSADLAANSVGTSEVSNNSLTAFDLAGGESNGTITLGAGYVANGRCHDANAAVGGTHTGDAVLFSINGSVPEGVLIYGVRVPSNGTLTVKVCNFTGGAFPAINNLPIAAVSISI